MALKGIDVSNHNGAVDWPRVAAAGYGFAWCKATEGLTFTDRRFAENWRGVKAAGLVRGAYHYAHPDLDAAAQARHFLAVVGPVGAGDMLALDIEAGTGDLSGWATAFLDAVKAGSGLPWPALWLYSGDAFYKDRNLAAASPGARRWIARYSSKAPLARWDMWQNADNGAVPGVGGNCDLNTWPEGAAHDPIGAAMAAFPNAVGAALRPGHWPHVWVFGRDGGVGAYPTPDEIKPDGTKWGADACPFFGNAVNDAQGIDFLGGEADADGEGYTLVRADGRLFHYHS